MEGGAEVKVEVEVEVESKVAEARSRSRQRRGEFGLGLKAKPVASGGHSPCLILGYRLYYVCSISSGSCGSRYVSFQVELFLTAMLMPS